MADEKKRSTMLISSAVIMCIAAFVAGFVCGSMVGEHKTLSRMASAPVVAPVVPAPVQTAAAGADAQAQHIGHLREEALQNPDNAEGWIKLGNACFDAGDADGAINAYQAALRIDGKNADVRTDMGSMYRMKGEPARAVECYDQALRDRPGHKNAIFNKGVTMLLDLEQPEQAVAFWQSVLKDDPGFMLSSGVALRQIMPEIVVDAGLQLEAHNKKETALRAYAQALSLDDSYAPALVHRAWLLEGMGRADEALVLWKRVLEMHPDATDPEGKPVRDRIKK